MNKEKTLLESYPAAIGAKEIMEILNISETTAYNLINSGQFKVIEFGRTKRVNRDVFERWFYGLDASA